MWNGVIEPYKMVTVELLTEYLGHTKGTKLQLYPWYADQLIQQKIAIEHISIPSFTITMDEEGIRKNNPKKKELTKAVNRINKRKKKRKYNRR